MPSAVQQPQAPGNQSDLPFIPGNAPFYAQVIGEEVMRKCVESFANTYFTQEPTRQPQSLLDQALRCLCRRALVENSTSVEDQAAKIFFDTLFPRWNVLSSGRLATTEGEVVDAAWKEGYLPIGLCFLSPTQLSQRHPGQFFLVASTGGYATVVQIILKREVIALTPALLGLALFAAAAKGHVAVVEAILSSLRAQAIPIEGPLGLGYALFWAAAKGHAEVVEAILKFPRAQEIHRGAVDFGWWDGGEALVKEAVAGNMTLVDTLLRLPRAQAIPLEGPRGLGLALVVAAAKGYVAVVEAILKFPRAQEIPVDGDWGLSHAFVEAAKGGHVDVVEAILKFPRAQEIPVGGPWGLGHAFVEAAKGGHVDVVEAILKFPRAQEIPVGGPWGLGPVFFGAVRERSWGVIWVILLTILGHIFDYILTPLSFLASRVRSLSASL